MVHVQTRGDGTRHRNTLDMDKSLEVGEWWKREERNGSMEKGMRGDDMENGSKEGVRMDSERIGNKGRERRREKDGEQGMEKLEAGKNTKGGRQGERGNEGQEKDN